MSRFDRGRASSSPSQRPDSARWRRQQLDALDRGRWVDPEAGKVSGRADMDLRLIRPSHVEAWVTSMTVATATRKRPRAPDTMKTRFVNVRSVFRAAVRDGKIAADPTTQVRLPRAAPTRGRHDDPDAGRGA